MNKPLENLPPGLMDDIPVPDVSQLITEDDTPVDNVFSEKQMRLLTEPLYSGWEGPPDGRPFIVAANVGVFPSATDAPLVPDVFLSLDTAWRQPMSEKRNRSYFIWEHGKPPDLVIEVVSNKEGGELDRKVRAYERMHVLQYVVFDPFAMLGDALLTRFEMHGGVLVQQEGDLWFSTVGLGLALWKSTYEGHPAEWLRWCREDRSLVPTGAKRADAADQRADAAAERADAAAERPERLAAGARRRSRRLTHPSGSSPSRRRGHAAAGHSRSKDCAALASARSRGDDGSR